MTKSLTGQYIEIERQALARLRERTGLRDLRVADVRSDEFEDRTVYQVVASSQLEPNADLVILVEESGREIGLNFGDLAKRLGRTPFDRLSDFAERATPLRVGGGRDAHLTPDQNQLVLEQGANFGPEQIVVTISEGELKPKLDIYFLCDTTGSMGAALPSVRDAAAQVIDRLVGAGTDAAFGAGSYKDFFGGGPPFSGDARISTDPNLAKNAIAAWTASGGGDTAEAQLFALDQIAEPPRGPIGWRNGAKGILVWFGDEPGHDPICQSISLLTYKITSLTVMQQLLDHMITVIAVNTGTGRYGLDGDPMLAELTRDYSAANCAPGGRENQAADFSYWTGGALIQGLDVANIVARIQDVLDSIAPQVPAAQVHATGSAGQFVAQFSQVEFGPWQTAEAIQFNFDVTFFGIVDCHPNADQTFTGAIEVWIGDQLGAEKRLNVTVPRCKPTIVDDPVAITHWDKTIAPNVELGSFVRGEHDTLLSCFFHPSQNNFVWTRHDTSRMRAGEVIEAMAVTSYYKDSTIPDDIYLFYVVASGGGRRLLLMVGSPILNTWTITEEFMNAQLHGASPLIGAGRIREVRRPLPTEDPLFPTVDTVYPAMVSADQQLYVRPYGYTTLPSFAGHGSPTNRLLSDQLNPFVAGIIMALTSLQSMTRQT
jgi:hypothetical protein